MNILIITASQRLQFLCDSLPLILKNIPEEDMLHKPAQGVWSKKEILGHLVDSATNNHQRFIRAQFEETPFIKYVQDDWNRFSYYNAIDTEFLIDLWSTYNRFIVHLITYMPESSHQRLCNTGAPNPQTLEFLISDYVSHMEHHLREITDYE